MSELKPCPFCGGQAEFVVKQTENGNGKVGFGFAIQCLKCNVRPPKATETVYIRMNADGEIEIFEDGRGKAVAAWNRRYPNENPKTRQG